MEPAWISNRQIEAARIAMTRHIKRGGKVWIRIFPDKPDHFEARGDADGEGEGEPRRVGRRGQARPDDVRDGRGSAEHRGAPMKLASAKLPIKTRFVVRDEELG
jgi:large subunit ribosomal protein L16